MRRWLATQGILRWRASSKAASVALHLLSPLYLASTFVAMATFTFFSLFWETCPAKQGNLFASQTRVLSSLAHSLFLVRSRSFNSAGLLHVCRDWNSCGEAWKKGAMWSDAHTEWHCWKAQVQSGVCDETTSAENRQTDKGCWRRPRKKLGFLVDWKHSCWALVLGS